MPTPPKGTVTFLFTDIEGSTQLWESAPRSMREALERHDGILRRALDANNGYVFATGGDGFAVAFERASDAVSAAQQIQDELSTQQWPDGAVIRVRIGIHTGEAAERGGDYFGQAVNRAARLMAVAYGGQVVCSQTTASLATEAPLQNLGEHRLRDVPGAEDVYQVGDGRFPPLRATHTKPGNLPNVTTSLIGRKQESAQVEDALRVNRLVTLVGVGGVGKTRLALQAASDAWFEFTDGAWLVELAPILDGSDLVEAVAGVFGVAPQADRNWQEGLNEALGSKKLLLVLDNCEHILDEAARLVETLLGECESVTILATSREALDVPGEWPWPVPPLDLGPKSSAVALFVERARVAAPGHNLDEELEAIVEICQRLDGIPLAIELAAARVRSMSVAQVRDRLDDRFRLLTGSRRSMERHQTLRNAVQWSYDLLDEAERTVLRRASVFVGGFTLAAAAVCGRDAARDLDEFEVLDLVDSLVRKSLLQVERAATELRYTMLETIRQFCQELLVESVESDDVRARHAAYYADAVDGAFEWLRGPNEALAYSFVDDEISNIRAAFRWAVDHERADEAIRIAAGCHEMARFRLRTETFGWAAEVVEIATRMEHRKLPLLLTMACDSAWALGQLDAAKAYGLRAIAVPADPCFEPFVWAYTDLGQVAFFEGDPAAGMELMRTGATHPSDMTDRFCLAVFLLFGELVGNSLPDDEFAVALDRVVATGFPTAIALALSAKGQRLADTDPAAAVDNYQQAIATLEACGNEMMETTTRALLVGVLSREHDADLALEAMLASVNAWRLNGDTIFLPSLGNLVVILERLGLHDGAARFLGAVTREVQLVSVHGLDDAIQQLRQSLGEAGYATALQAGTDLNLQQAADLATELIAAARADLAAS